MERPIKETPILTGKDAKAFIEAVEANKTQKVSATERARMKKNFDYIKSIATFEL